MAHVFLMRGEILIFSAAGALVAAMMRWAKILWILPLLWSLWACGPIMSGVGAINAKAAVRAAKNAGAERYALYEITAAREYLRKSREESGYSDFERARKYANKSLILAKRAKDMALEGTKTSANTAEDSP